MSYSFTIIRQAAVSYRIDREPWFAPAGLTRGYPGHGAKSSGHDELEQYDGSDTFWLLLFALHRFSNSTAFDDIGWLLDNRIPFTVKLSLEPSANLNIVTLCYDIRIADKQHASLFKLFRR